MPMPPASAISATATSGAAVRAIVDRADKPVRDQPADAFAGAPLGLQIDRRGRTLAAAVADLEP